MPGRWKGVSITSFVVLGPVWYRFTTSRMMYVSAKFTILRELSTHTVWPWGSYSATTRRELLRTWPRTPPWLRGGTPVKVELIELLQGHWAIIRNTFPQAYERGRSARNCARGTRLWINLSRSTWLLVRHLLKLMRSRRRVTFFHKRSLLFF